MPCLGKDPSRLALWWRSGLPSTFQMPQRSEEVLIPTGARPGRFQEAGLGEQPDGDPPPPVAPVPPAPGSSGSDPLVTVAREGMEVVLSPEGPHAQLDLEPHRCSGHLSRSHRRVWTGAGAARLGG